MGGVEIGREQRVVAYGRKNLFGWCVRGVIGREQEPGRECFDRSGTRRRGAVQ